ncbi:MAG: TetR/AcrR family transcriptional regulator [Nocardioidaceae bacterium]
MTTTSSRGAAAPTRRERQRQATFEEIVSVSRALLRSGEKPSLRAVANAMGMTPPALYRYVDSHQDLLDLVARSIFEDVVRVLTEARSRYPDDDPGAQILVCTIAFRRWALSHPQEFGLIFASTETIKSDDATPEHDAAIGATAFGNFFGDIYVRVWQRYGFDVPTDAEIDPAVLTALREHEGPEKLPCDFPGMPIGLGWLFLRAWGRLYGTVTLEVFRHMDPVIIDSGALFIAMLEDNARELNFGDDWPRLRELARMEMTG